MLIVLVPGCMFLFGIISCLQGTVQNFSGLLATRFFLGMCESSTFPGCSYLIMMQELFSLDLDRL
jgi:hypothetical protein